MIGTGTYSKNDALNAIRNDLTDWAEDHDIEAIFDAAFAYDKVAGGFYQAVDGDEFWQIVEANAR